MGWLDPTGGAVTINHVFACTDLGNAHRFVNEHVDSLRYVPHWRTWVEWDGRRWVIDRTGAVYRAAATTSMSIAQEAWEAEGDRRRELQKWWRLSESEGRIRAMVNLASKEGRLIWLPEHLDVNPWLFNVSNGTIDLRTGRLNPHERVDQITKLAPVEYNADARCPMWLAFLDRVLAGDADVIEFFQRAVGYTLTGSTREQVLFLIYGAGANGKTTLLETLRSLLGEYATQAEFSTFLLSGHQTVRNDLARLVGARFVSAGEVDQGRRLAESVVKQITGGDRITARFLYSEHFEFTPSFKLFLAVNHKPTIRGTDNAIWRRIRLIPFTVTIPPDERDRDLTLKLSDELPGILTWAVEGCLCWQKDGLGEPEVVRAATRDYQEEMDALADFFADRCEFHPAALTEGSELYAAYKEWCGNTGEMKCMSRNAFGSQLAERGYTRRNSSKSRRVHYMGIEVRKELKPSFAKVPYENQTRKEPERRLQEASVASQSNVDSHG